MTDEDKAEIARLATLPILDYERERGPAASRMECRASILDALVEAARREHPGPGNTPDSPTPDGTFGHALIRLEIVPWPEVVEGHCLLDELAQTIRRHIVLEDAAADAMALWAVHTHAISTANISPRLAITSPEKRCGKSTLLTLLSAVVAAPVQSANMTTATLFRSISAIEPTLLIDEADTFISGKEEMRGIINAGHSRANAYVMRNVPTPDGWETRCFYVFGALAIAAIGEIPSTIIDRSINIRLRRRRLDEPVDRLRIDRLEQYAPLRRKAARWVADHQISLSAADPDVPAELHDRAADNWRPLIAIADIAGGDWPERASRAAIALSKVGADDSEEIGIMLLADLRELFATEPSGVLFSNDIVERLAIREDRPWAEYRRGQEITKVQLAALVKAFGITTNQTVRRGAQTGKGYKAEWFADVWRRYLPPL